MASPDFVTEQMCQALKDMQKVPTWDWHGIYDAAYGGIWGLDPRTSESAAKLIYGRSLAIRMRLNAQGILNEMKQ